MLRRASGEAVRAAIDELPEEFREVIVLRELEGLSYKQIAAVAGVPVGTVMSRLARARGRLEHALAPSMVEEGGLP
jgi:RNA polymerase sigma-70 factor (ECF subfamily)